MTKYETRHAWIIGRSQAGHGFLFQPTPDAYLHSNAGSAGCYVLEFLLRISVERLSQFDGFGLYATSEELRAFENIPLLIGAIDCETGERLDISLWKQGFEEGQKFSA